MLKRSTITMLAFLAIALFGAGTARADTSFSCTVTRVLEWADRVDVACSNTITINGDLVQFFAIAKTDAARASRWMSTAVSALLAGKPFVVLFGDTPAGNIPNCPSNNCRTPYAFGVQR